MVPDRKIPPRIRSSHDHYRDSHLVVIAAEGRKTEKKYLVDLAARFHNSRVKVLIVDTEENRSSPEHVIEKLNGFTSEFSLEEDDTVWLVVDVDRWGEKKLAEVARQALQKHYQLAVSNPCFELWMLLHHRSLDQYTPDTLQEFRQNLKDGANRTRLERELVAILGKHNKTKPDAGDFTPHVEKAIERARALDTKPEDRWPNDLGSHVYRLVIQIIEKVETFRRNVSTVGYGDE